MSKPKEEKIDWSLLTPEAAFKRITEYADKMAENYPPLIFNVGGTIYTFSWDKQASYLYQGFDGYYHRFMRMHDGAIAKMTKYSFLPWDRPEEVIFEAL